MVCVRSYIYITQKQNNCKRFFYQYHKGIHYDCIVWYIVCDICIYKSSSQYVYKMRLYDENKGKIDR